MSEHIIAIASYGYIVHFDGNQWRVLEEGLAGTRSAAAACALSNGDILIARYPGGGIDRFVDYVSTVEVDLSDEQSPVRISGFWRYSDTDIYAVAYQWRPGAMAEPYSDPTVAWLIYHYDGTGWSKQGIGDLQVVLNAVWGSPTGRIWLVGGGGTIVYREPVI